jgi:very-short-patch-repair endonuclease/mRNA-degrading endonuclease RelE of RelBE toxin-antitoxin system
MLDLISEEELNKKRSYKDIDKDNGEKLRELIEDKFLNQTELAEYFNCGERTIQKRIKKYNINYKVKTTKQFKYEVKHLEGNEYSVLGEYINSKTKIKMKHNKCGHKYKVPPNYFLNGNRCPKCNKNFRKTTEKFKKEVYELVGNEYTVLGEYINNKTKIKMKHNKCGYIYKVMPSNFLTGKRCSKCQWNSLKTTEKFKKEIYELVGNEYSVLSEYINSRTKIKIKHNKCGYIYNTEPGNLLKGRRCPICNSASNTELKIYNWINSKFNNFYYEYTDHKCRDKKLLSFDFFIDNLVIEYDGLQHFKKEDFFSTNLKTRRKRDKIKNQYCKENGIRLIRIPYWQKDNIENILESIFINDELNQRWSLKEYWSENKDIDYLVVC